MVGTNTNIISFLVFYLLILVIAKDDHCNKPSELTMSMKIKEHVFCDYDKTIRPVLDNTAIAIKLFLLIHHFEFNVHRTTINIDAWVGMKWRDEHIYWNLKDFNFYETIFVSTDDLWTPDISIYNRGPYEDTELIQDSSECLIFYHKQVICATPTKMAGTCWPDLRYWPFDVQNCTIKIGSWYHTGEEININDTDFAQDTSKFYENPEWDLTSIKLTKERGIYKQFPNSTYPSIKLQVLLRRHYSGKIVFIVIPYLVLILMTLLIGWLDPKLSERIYIATMSIPCHIMFLLNSTWELPETAESMPYLILLLRNSQFLATITLIETIIVRWLLDKTSESPKWILDIFSFVANNKFAQILLFSELNPENAVENMTADDSANLVEFKKVPKEWNLLGRVIDRLYFVFLVSFCLIMFIICIPK